MSNPKCFPKITFVSQEDGPTLGLSEGSGVSILQEDGRFFKDLNRDGKLD